MAKKNVNRAKQYKHQNRHLLKKLSIVETSGHPTGTEGRSNVKASCMGIDIQDLPSKMKTGDQLTF